MASEGIILNPAEGCPADPYTLSRKEPQHSYVTPATFDKLKQFIDLDRQVCIYTVRGLFGGSRTWGLALAVYIYITGLTLSLPGTFF